MPRRRSTRPASTSSPASSIRTSTSTIPGRAEWEGFETGTAAFAAGGGTCFFDMPLNASPPTVDGASFDLKVEAARGTALVDFGLWGGLVPGDLDRLDELAGRGVIGFKAFMCNTGIGDFEQADDRDALRGHGAGGEARPPRRRPRRERRRHPGARGARPSGGAPRHVRLPRVAPRGGRARGGRPRDRDRRGDGLLAAHRSREHGRCGAARRRGALPWRRRDLRDVPALPPAHRRGRGADRRAREVLAAAAATGRGRGALGGAPRGHDPVRHLRSLPGAGRHEDRRRRVCDRGEASRAARRSAARCSPSPRAAA